MLRSEPRMPRLVYKDSGGRELVLGLRDKDVVIGRQADCDLVVSSPSTSRKHAKVHRRGARWLVSDLGSSHGTRVNGDPLEKDHILAIGDEVQVGEAVVRFEEGPAPVLAKGSASTLGARTSATNPAMFVGERPTGSLEIPKTRKSPEPSAPVPPRETGEVVESSRLDSGEWMAAMTRARKMDIRDKPGTETGTLMALVRISDELRQCVDEDAVCETVARMALQATGASRAWLAVKSVEGGELVPRVVLDGPRHVPADELMISTTFIDKVIADRVALVAMDTDRDVSLAGAASVVAVGIRSILCSPLWDGSDILGVLYLDMIAGKGKAFRRVDVDLVTAIGHQAAAEIRRLRLAQRVRNEESRRKDLARFVSADVIRHIEKESRAGRLDPTASMQEQLCTILFADLVGFTALAEQRSPTEVKKLLDDYLGYMMEILVDKHGGTLDKFLGDGIMALFGAPFSRGPAEDARAAVGAALEMRDTLDLLRRMRPDFKQVKVRIGINSGRVVAGMIGTPRRSEYSVIGDAVNVASRLEAAATPGMILIGDATYQVVRSSFECEFAGEKLLKNRESTVKAWWVNGPIPGTAD